MTVTVRNLTGQYRSALEDYLRGGGEVLLQRAYELGRQALDEGLGVLEMVALQHEALAAVLKQIHPNEQSPRTAQAAETFLLESFSAFEMTHRGFQEGNIALRRLNDRLNEKLEQEAKRIGHALHDESEQLLAAVHIALDQVIPEVSASARRRLKEVKGLLKQVEGQLRQLSHELRPRILDELGVGPAIEFLAQAVSARAGIPVVVQGAALGRLPSQVETVLYRTVQEALANATKHARATRVSIRFVCEAEMVRCTVSDDGIGFKLSEVLSRKGNCGLGLIGMRERVDTLKGALEIDSAPQRGTELRVAIPLKAAR